MRRRSLRLCDFGEVENKVWVFFTMEMGKFSIFIFIFTNFWNVGLVLMWVSVIIRKETKVFW